MKKITIYTGPFCNYCDAAKRLLTRNNATYNEIDIGKVDGAMDEMIKKANGKRTIPQIFFNDTATTEIYTSLFVGSVRCV